MSDQQHPSGSLAPRTHRFRFSWLFSLIPYLVLIGTALGSLPAGAAFTQVDVGTNHAVTGHICGVKRGGAVACWGYSNDFNKASPPGGIFTQVSAGGTHTCGVKSDDTVACWGLYTSGQTTPPAGVAFTQVSAGGDHSCGVKSDDTVACWGNNTSGQATPPAGVAFTQVSAGGDYTCGVRSDGTNDCWGYGQTTYHWEWDAGQDFSATQNPTATGWSYGWSETREGPFILSELPFNLANTSLETVHFWLPSTNPTFIPVSNHLGNDLLVVNSTQLQTLVPVTVPSFWAVIPPYTMLMYPGPNGEYSVVRWTAPAARQYIVGSKFWGVDAGGTTTDNAVLFNGTIVEEHTIFFSNYYETTHLESQRCFCANRGDTIDFKVGSGNGSYDYDTTALLALIWQYDHCTYCPYYSLAVYHQGAGSGTVTSNGPGIAFPHGSVEPYLSDTQLR